jgi:hypothetical protein
MASITTILVIAGLLALLTNAIGVHLVLGAFIAGVLVGQSPILTKHIDTQLRGLIVALFMPVFFALAGLSTDMRALAKPERGKPAGWRWPFVWSGAGRGPRKGKMFASFRIKRRSLRFGYRRKRLGSFRRSVPARAALRRSRNCQGR